ncbi:hypothetical protein, partial [Stenotrophomonas sp.]|uniref:hypothetical protein n=1 Tax=Stenotrophomonas sp. TaxID=69392 RepID=UPI0028ACDFD2
DGIGAKAGAIPACAGMTALEQRPSRGHVESKGHVRGHATATAKPKPKAKAKAKAKPPHSLPKLV